MGVRIQFAVALALVAAGCIQAPDDTTDDAADGTPTPTTPTVDACARTTPPVPTTPPSSLGGGQAAVSNEPGSFSYAEQAVAKQGTYRAVWKNPSAAAQVMWSGQTSAGSFTLTLLDACDKEVHRAQIGAGSQGGAMEATQSGMAGDWVVEMEFALYSGQMSLQISSG